MGRKPCCEKVGLKRGPWTTEEDQKLVSYITNSGLGCWRAIPKLAGLLRCGKSCRLRWTNYLRPDLKRGIFTEEEENLILDLHATLGNRWSRIAAQLPGRTDNEIKNYWNTRLKKRLRSQGLDPATHLPFDSSNQEDGAGDDSDCADGEDGELSDARGRKSRKKVAKQVKEPAKPVRQPRGPKPAPPQLKMCQSDEGLFLIKVPKSVESPTSVATTTPAPPASWRKCDDDQHSESLSSSSTVTTKSGADDHHESSLACKLRITTLPSYPEAELWKSIITTSGSPTTTSVGMQQMDYNMMHFTSHPPAHDCVGESMGNIFPGACFPQPEIGMPWNMDIEMCQPAPDSLFSPNESLLMMNPAGMIYHRELHHPALHQQSPDLQRLAAILDLI